MRICAKYRRGFSLIELLVVLGVLMIILSLAVPVLFQSKKRSEELACLHNVSQLGQLVAGYVGDYQDKVPALYSDKAEHLQTSRDVGRYAMQPVRVFSSPEFLDPVGLARTSRILRCPAHRKNSDPRLVYPIDYQLLVSLYVDPAYLAPDPPSWTDPLDIGAHLQTFGSIVFPDAKVTGLEFDVWHHFNGTDEIGADVGALEYYNSAGPGSVWFADGHAAFFHARDATSPVRRSAWWGAGAFSNTPWGVRGRDRR